MIYTLINPSDRLTIETDNPTAAKVFALFHGNGAHFLEDEHGATVMHAYLFGFDEREWLAEHAPGCATLEDVWDAHAADIAAAARSAAIASVSDRKAAPDVFRDNPLAMSAWNARKRTSMNDLISRAEGIATFADRRVALLAAGRSPREVSDAG